MAQFLDTSITGSLTLSGSLTPITFPGTNTRIEVGDPNGTDYSLNFRSNRYYYFQDSKLLYVQGSIVARNGIYDDGGPLALGHATPNIMYLSGSSVGIGTSTPSTKLDIASVFTFNTTTDLFQISNNTNTGGINLSGGNSRIYFGGNRAIEGAQNGSSLTIGEGYSTIYLQDDTIINGDLTVSGIVT